MDKDLAWEAAKPGRAGHACYRAYSRLFLPFAVLVLVTLPLNGREIIWNVDGMSQYYAFFVYEGELIRGIVAELLSGNGLNFPLWEWHSGYGADIPTTFDVLFDPLNLVSVIVPARFSEWAFQVLVLVRLYLAGLAFVFYCRTRGENRRGTVLGALLYALCGAGLTAVRWASGLHAFILFPVVLAGAERVLAGERPWVFVASLTALAIVSYYFTYMACILLVGYLALRVVMIERPSLTPGRFLRWVAVFAGLVALSLALAGFALVPSVVALLGMDRVANQATTVPLLYSPGYYLRLFTGFLSTSEVGSDTYQGFGGLAFLACLALFSQRKRNTELKLVFVVLSAFFLLPAVGSFFNGLNYATNRWAWAYALCVAFVLTRMTPRLLSLDARQKRVLAVGTAAYAVFLLAPPVRTEANMAGFAVLVAALAVLLAECQPETRRALLTCALAATLGVNGLYFLSTGAGGKASMQVPLGMAYAKLTSASVDSLALETGDDAWWRYDAGQVAMGAHAPMNRVRNNSMVLGLNGIDFYSSIYDSDVDAFHTELAIAGDYVNFSYINLQGRSDLMSLLGVKYYAFRDDGTDSLPYGFDARSVVVERPVMTTGYRLVRANDSLPLGFTFDRAISRGDYLALTPVERQQALLQAVVLDEGDMPEADPGAGAGLESGSDGAEVASAQRAGARRVGAAELDFESEDVAFRPVSTQGALVEDGRIVATADGASVTFQVEGAPDAETYLYVAGLNYQGLKPSDYVPDDQKAQMSWYYRANLMMQDLSYVAPMEYEITVAGDATPAPGYIYNTVPEYHVYGGKDTWLVNLGYSEKEVSQVTVSFSVAGEYTFNDLRMQVEPHGKSTAHVDGLSADVLEGVRLGCNSLTGSIDLDAPKTLLVTAARADGWTARVDGAPAQLAEGDTAFMALNLTAGHHEIELSYMTPGLLEGIALSCAGLVALVALKLAGDARRRGKRKNVGRGEA